MAIILMCVVDDSAILVHDRQRQIVGRLQIIKGILVCKSFIRLIDRCRRWAAAVVAGNGPAVVSGQSGVDDIPRDGQRRSLRGRDHVILCSLHCQGGCHVLHGHLQGAGDQSQVLIPEARLDLILPSIEILVHQGKRTVRIQSQRRCSGAVAVIGSPRPDQVVRDGNTARCLVGIPLVHRSAPREGEDGEIIQVGTVDGQGVVSGLRCDIPLCPPAWHNLDGEDILTRIEGQGAGALIVVDGSVDRHLGLGLRPDGCQADGRSPYCRH